VAYPTGFQEYALFGDLTYHFTDRFDLQLGSRVAHTQLDFTETESGPVIGDTPLVIDRIAAKSTPVTYLMTPRFKISQDWMVYARLASGYRSGGTNGEALPDATIPRQYDPDKTYNYELGIKGDLLDHRFSFDASVFYIDWKSVQLSVIAPASQQAYISNVGRAKSDGVELSVMARPLDGLSINAWATYNDAVLKNGFPVPTDVSPGIYGVAGSRLPYGSQVSGHLSIDDEYPIVGDLRGVLGATLSYVGNRLGEFTPGPPNPPARTSYPAYTQADLRVGCRVRSWNVDATATNVFNKRGILGGGLASYPPYAFTLIQPRTIGLSVSTRF
jgi:iron complex outermembrane recepter protein